MATQKFRAADIKGFMPSVNPTESEDVYALNGRNYIFDTRGPKSAFGNRLLLPHPRSKPQYMQGMRVKFRTGDRCFSIDGDGIWEWDEDIGGYVAIYLTPDTTISPYRWTYGYLSGYVYLAHPRVGILCYNIETGVCLPHSELGTATPTDVLSIVVNNGRLVAITTTLFQWSDPSNGLEFTPSLGGAGFQLISDIIAGNPIMVSGYARGCLTWTSGGVMRSEFTGDSVVWRHKPLNTEYRPANSFCICKVDDDSSIVLDERGLFKTKGDTIEPYTPLFNEFLLEYIQANQLAKGNNLRIEWDDLQRRLYVSVSLSYASPLYEQAFVLYPALDKWGQFNEAHYGILPIQIDTSIRSGNFFGFADAQGQVRFWKATGSRESDPRVQFTRRSANLYYPATQKPVQYTDAEAGRILSASGRASGFAKDTLTQAASYYESGETVPSTPIVTGLDALIQFGLFRPTGPVAADELSEIFGVIVKSVKSGPEDVVSLDYNLVPPATEDEDYDTAEGAEDFGFENYNYVNHKLRLIGTKDGETMFCESIPLLVDFTATSRNYSCSCVGIWHIVEVSAEEVGEAFHVQTFNFTAGSAGRLL